MSVVCYTYSHACSYYSYVTDKRLFRGVKMEIRSLAISLSLNSGILDDPFFFLFTAAVLQTKLLFFTLFYHS